MIRPHTCSRGISATLLVVFLLSFTISMHAATRRWSGAAGTSDWLAGPNWSPANVPTVNDDVVFDNSLITVPGSMVINGGDVEAQTITFQPGFNATSTTVIGGGASHPSFLTIGGAGTGASPLVTVNSTTGTITFDRRNGGSADLSIILGATSAINVNAGATLVLNCDLSGSYGFTKTGPGILRLSGTNTYTGDTTISQGTLFLGANGSSICSISNSPTVRVNSGAVLDVSGITFALQSSQTLGGSGGVNGSVTAASGATIVAGPAGSAGTLTFSNSLTLNGVTLVFDLSNLITEGNGVNDEVIVSGNLSLVGNNIIRLNYLNGSLSAGTYKILKFNGSKSGNFTLGASYPNVALDQTTTPNYVTLVVSSPGSSTPNLTWKGDGANNLWDMGSTANWLDGANPSPYYDPAQVTFNDSGSFSPAINLTTTVTPKALTVNAAGNYTISGSGKIGGMPGLTNGLVKSGGGALVLNTTNDFTGGVNIQAGTLRVGNPFAIPSGPARGDVALSGTLDLNGNSLAVNGISGPGTVDNSSGTLTNTLTFGANNGNGALSGVIKNTSGTVALSKVGAGTITLSGDNSFSGATAINDGALRISHVNALGNLIGNTTIAGGTTQARLEMTGGISISEPLTLAMKFGIGAGTLDPQRPHIENISGVNTLVGALTLTGGGTYWTFQSDTGKLIIAQGLSSTATGGRPILLQGAGDGEIQGSIQNGSGFVALVKSGSGVWTLSANNSFSQGVTINAGTLRVANANAIPNGAGKGDVTVNGTLDLNSQSITLNGLLGTGTVDNQAGSLNYVLTLGNNNGAGNFSGAIRNTTGTLGLTKIGSGTLTLSGNNTYSGNTIVSAGTLLVSGSIASGSVTVGTTAILSGSGTIGGPATVQAGGTLSPGPSIAAFTINNSLSLSGATLMEINKSGASLTSDLVKGVTTLNYGGTLTVTATGDPLAENDSFNLFDANSFNGTFSAVNLPTLASCLVWDTSKLTVDGTIRVTHETVAPVIGTIGATETQTGSVNVKNCANPALQGTVNIAVSASDDCALAAPPVVALTNGANTGSAVFINESPAGTFNYTWAVVPATAAGTWTATATATDTAGNKASSSFTICVTQQYQVTGQVEPQSFVGNTLPVTFVATSSANTPLATNTLTLSFAGTPRVASYSLSVPPNTANISAKTAWTLRKRLAVAFSNGQATLNFTSTTKLLGGDVTGDNRVNTSDNNLFKTYNGKIVATTPAAVQADITGDGRVNTSDYNILKSNLGKTGEAQ